MLKKSIWLAAFALLSFAISAQDVSTALKSYKFRNVGPQRGGRVTTVEGVVSKPSVFYMGATGGGVWKTDDYGITWKNISDGYPYIDAYVQHLRTWSQSTS